MEEILDSIRRIIADDEPGRADLPLEPLRPVPPARRPVAGYGQRPAGPAGERSAATPQQRAYGREPDQGVPSFDAQEPGRDDPRYGRPAGGERRQPVAPPPDDRFADFEYDEERIGRAVQAPPPASLGRTGLRPEGRQEGRATGGGGAPRAPVRAATPRRSWDEVADHDSPARDAELNGGGLDHAAPSDSAGERGSALQRGGADAPIAYEAVPQRPDPRPVADLPPVRPQPAARVEPAALPAVERETRVEPPRVERPARRSEPVADAPQPAAAVVAGEWRAALPRKDLLSPAVDVAVAAAFKSLGDLVLPQQERTVEDLVKEILRPMLKEWLDQNLAGIVERLVRAEIERVTSTLR
ncbi:DUF2497 domain-containing protein [Xanthobacter sp. V4C-4]|uniref:PopZ family protein n=1 Tax=Xanthobacter cornucopiae TaxID=3119924 RepID=UPI003727EF71